MFEHTWVKHLTTEELDAIDDSPTLALRNSEDNVYSDFVGLRNAYYKKWLKSGLLRHDISWGRQDDFDKINMVLCKCILPLIVALSFATAFKC